MKLPSSVLSEERELRKLIFRTSLSNLLRCLRFSFVIALTVINKVNDLRVSRDLWVKYKFVFNRRCPRRRRSGFLNSLLYRLLRAVCCIGKQTI